MAVRSLIFERTGPGELCFPGEASAPLGWGVNPGWKLTPWGNVYAPDPQDAQTEFRGRQKLVIMDSVVGDVEQILAQVRVNGRAIRLQKDQITSMFIRIRQRRTGSVIAKVNVPTNNIYNESEGRFAWPTLAAWTIAPAHFWLDLEINWANLLVLNYGTARTLWRVVQTLEA